MKITVSFTEEEVTLYNKAKNNDCVSKYIKRLIRHDMATLEPINTNTPKTIQKPTEKPLDTLKDDVNKPFNARSFM